MRNVNCPSENIGKQNPKGYSVDRCIVDEIQAHIKWQALSLTSTRAFEIRF